LLLAFDRHLVRTARRCEDRNDETNHRDDDDRANRNDQLQPREIEARPLAVPGVVWLRRKVHAPTLGVSWRSDDKAKKIAIRLRLMQAKGYRTRLKSLPELTRRKPKPSTFPQAHLKCMRFAAAARTCGGLSSAAAVRRPRNGDMSRAQSCGPA